MLDRGKYVMRMGINVVVKRHGDFGGVFIYIYELAPSVRQLCDFANVENVS